MSCDCNGLRGAGFFEIDDEWLVLKSTLGERRVRLGISNPRKLAGTLLRNLCVKAAAASPPNAIEPKPSSPSVSEKAQGLVDTQRDKIVAMAADDPQRGPEERILDQMIETSRRVETASVLLAPEQPDDAQSPSLSPAYIVVRCTRT